MYMDNIWQKINLLNHTTQKLQKIKFKRQSNQYNDTKDIEKL
jgi:hypothetical protein